MSSFLAVLASLIAPLENYAEQKLESVGAAFLSAMGVVFNTFTNDQRVIAANVTAYWQAKYAAALAAGDGSLGAKIAAIDTASAHTLGEFIKEEGQEGSKVIQMTITALEISVENSLTAS